MPSEGLEFTHLAYSRREDNLLHRGHRFRTNLVQCLVKQELIWVVPRAKR